MEFDREKWDAVLFDMDGVLTQTAKVHATAWKEMLDHYLKQRSKRTEEEFVPFQISTDYRQYIDGKLRYDGVRGFLRSRGIELPEGEPSDPPDRETICGLGNRKNNFVVELLRAQGVETYEYSVKWVRHLREIGVKTAVVSASKNCELTLKAAGIVDLFDCRVDGHVVARLGLAGKPAPDSFLEAARELEVEPSRAVVVEDAISGVQAGKAGGFGLVIGVDRHHDPEGLRRAGADIVVEDLGEFSC